MALTGTKTFVGLGFGPIQAGVFLYEAYRSGNFAHLTVAYRRPEVIAAVRRNGGMIALNIAHPDGLETVTFGPIALLDTGDSSDQVQLVHAVAEADELATALSSVADYRDVAPLLAQGLSGKPKLIYAAENHTRAAELLQMAIADHIAIPDTVQLLNTVIGKMSTVVSGAELAARGLAPIAPGLERAFLVEAFNRILIEQIRLPGLRCGIACFAEKADLAPFEAAKLYGHNAVHALAAYLTMALGKRYLYELAQLPKLMQFLREALVREAGASLIQKYRGYDALFSEVGFAAYADELLARMTNPYLADTAARVGRDPLRKLGWEDRLVGAMRLALSQGITPWRFATGVVAALEMCCDGRVDVLHTLWRQAELSDKTKVMALVVQAIPDYHQRLIELSTL
jgi:mannitol-1-phosphate 5-dehydrogenase